MSDPRPLSAQSARRRWHESAPARYGLALAMVATASLLTLALRGAVGAQAIRSSFALFYLAVFLTARYLGRGAALFAVLLSALVGNYFFLQPDHVFSLAPSGLIQTAVFAFASLLVVYLTDRSRRAEAAARESRESMETTLKSIGDAVIATDGDGRVRFMNPVAERLTGWPLADASGRPLAEVFRIVDEQTREPVERVLREGQVVGLANHTVLVARDGREVPVEDSGAPITDERGRTTGVVLVFHDASERRESEQRLRESEQRFRALADTAPVMIWMSDREGSFEYFNKPWLDFTGRAPGEERGGGWVAGVHPEDVAACLEVYRSSSEARRPFTREFRLRRRDGDYRWVLDHGAPRHSAGGEFLGYVGSCVDIHEHKEAERRLSLMAAVVESSGEAIVGKTLDGTIASWNAAATRLYGYTAEEAVGRHISLVVPPELRGDLADILERVGRGERVERPETVRLRKDGSRLDVSLVISPILDPSGRPVGASSIARDITEQKRAAGERAALGRLVEHERARLQNLLAHVPGVVWEAWGEPDESSQRINFVSEHVEQMLGYTVEEWLSTPNFWLTIIHPEDRERAAAEARAIYESREGGVSQFRWVRRDGRVIHVEAQSLVILDEEGRPVGMRGVTMDISERKEAEGRLRFLAEASRVLGSSLDYETTLEGLARLAVAALADYCLIDLVDDDGRVRRVAATHADPARQPLAERLRAFPPGPQSAGVPRVLRTGQPESVAEVTEEVLRAMARDEEHARLLRELGLKSFITVPLVARGRTIGALTFSSTRASRRYTAEDVAFAQEIAARAALAIENARLYGRAQEVNRAKDEFLATLSHELRTPLTPILGWTHMIRSGRLGPAETAQGFRVIEKNSQSLSRLINDLLDMSSILSGKMRIERAPVDLSSVVREAAETVRPQADARAIALEVEAGGPDAPVVSGDRTRLVQVFWNLLHNAVKFSAEGARVRVRVGAANGSARVEVEDDGAGIAPEFLPHVFERFRQADGSTTRQHGGLGLGLALVKSFVEAHGGTVAVESAGEGRGSRFTVSLPASESGGARRSSGDLDAGAAAPRPEETCHVLLVEDAPDTLDMLKVAFESRGYTAAACATPEEALRVAESGRFDIIVSDIGLPRIDGYELIARLRRLPHLRAVPALALTGYAAQRDAEAALAAGFDAHVPKPVDPSELAERMEQLMRRDASGAPEV